MVKSSLQGKLQSFVIIIIVVPHYKCLFVHTDRKYCDPLLMKQILISDFVTDLQVSSLIYVL